MTSCHPYPPILFTLAIVIVMTCSPASAGETELASFDSEEHPLQWTLRYARARADYIRDNIRDYSCRLIKRERIGGKLQPYQFAQVKVRCGRRANEGDAEPLAVFMQYLAPSTIRDRRVLFVEGQNSGKVLVRKGGPAFKYLRLRIDPNGTAARRESNYPITDIGFNQVIQRLIDRVSEDMTRDPDAANTTVSHFRGAKVGDRVCTHIRVMHPNQEEGFNFYRASLYVDDQLKVPIRLVVYGWPEAEGEKPPLLEEYTYVNLKLNVGLTDSDFAEEKLE